MKEATLGNIGIKTKTYLFVIKGRFNFSYQFVQLSQLSPFTDEFNSVSTYHQKHDDNVTQ